MADSACVSRLFDRGKEFSQRDGGAKRLTECRSESHNPAGIGTVSHCTAQCLVSANPCFGE